MDELGLALGLEIYLDEIEMTRFSTKSTLLTIAFVACLTCAYGTTMEQVHNTSYVTREGERVLRFEVLVPLPLASVWDAWTTSRGLSKWIAPVAVVDFNVGGKIQTNYDSTAKIGSAGTIELLIINYIDMQLITLKVRLNDRFPRIFATRITTCKRSYSLSTWATETQKSFLLWWAGEPARNGMTHTPSLPEATSGPTSS